MDLKLYLMSVNPTHLTLLFDVQIVLPWPVVAFYSDFVSSPKPSVGLLHPFCFLAGRKIPLLLDGVFLE